MEGLRSFTYLSTYTPLLHHHPQQQHHQWHFNSNRKCPLPLKAKLGGGGDDPLLQAAVTAATLRFHETLRSEPLFHDHYAACLVSDTAPAPDMKQQTHSYCLATRFIDDQLFHMLRTTDELKQVVLLTDGADTRSFRLSWPNSTLIYDISPDRIYSNASQKLKGVGAQIPKSCLLLHIPLESSDIQEALRKKGFNGNRPSIWVLQGLPLMTLTTLEDFLFIVGSLAMKGCALIGEIPAWLAETNLELRNTREEWLHKLFMSHGFQVQMIDLEDVGRSLGKVPSKETYNRILFIAKHLRFSDDQIETWRREFERAEEEGDEDGFEDL